MTHRRRHHRLLARQARSRRRLDRDARRWLALTGAGAVEAVYPIATVTGPNNLGRPVDLVLVAHLTPAPRQADR